MDSWSAEESLTSGADPWLAVGSQTSATSSSCKGNSFDDAFTDGAEAGVVPCDGFERLPDSAQYLALLEKRLSNLKRRKESGKAFQEHKDEIIGKLLRSESRQLVGILSETDLQLDREVDSNQLLRQLVPKQPRTLGETVHLVKADQLDLAYAENLEKSSSQ